MYISINGTNECLDSVHVDTRGEAKICPIESDDLYFVDNASGWYDHYIIIPKNPIFDKSYCIKISCIAYYTTLVIR